jgi:hypothetical protein
MQDFDATEGALQSTLVLFETGLELMRQNLAREDPTATAQEIETRLVRWLHHRPGAELGDAPGRLITLRDPSV